MKNTNTLIDVAKQSIRTEIDTLRCMLDNIGVDFIQCLLMIDSLKGKLVFSGIGKSGIVAKKIAASFTSISIPSVYIHPCDAFHGDFGLINSDDIVFVISNSGQTQEVLNFVEFIKKRDCKIISMTCNKMSSIARLSDVVLELQVTQEDSIYNIIPTSSIVAQCAMSDALIVSLIKLKGLTKEKIFYNHPGGNIGLNN